MNKSRIGSVPLLVPKSPTFGYFESYSDIMQDLDVLEYRQHNNIIKMQNNKQFMRHICNLAKAEI